MCCDLGHGQHQHNRHDQGNVEPEQLGTVQFIHFGDSFHADGLRLGGRVVARSTLFFIPGEQDTQAKDQNNSDNLCGDAIPPDLRGADFQRGGGASAGATPGHDIHNAHGQGCDAQQVDGPHIHFLINRKQRRDADQQGGCTGAIQMANEGNQHRGKHQQCNVIAHQFQNLAHDHIENTGIVHNTEEQNREDKQDCRGRHTGHAGGNISAHLLSGKADSKANDDGKENENHRRCTLSPEQQGYDQNHQSEACKT